MTGFVGMINGKMCNSAMEFIVEARNENGEKVPKDALKQLMNSLTISEIESNLFTKKEIKVLDGVENYNKTKLYKLEYKDSEPDYDDDDDDWTEDNDDNDEEDTWAVEGCTCEHCISRQEQFK